MILHTDTGSSVVMNLVCVFIIVNIPAPMSTLSQLFPSLIYHMIKPKAMLLKFPTHLEGLVYSHGQFSSYEPEVGVFIVITTPALMSTISQLLPGLI